MTGALEGIQLVAARAVVETRTVGTFVHVHVAMATGPARLADASVIADEVSAGRRVDARA